MLNNMLRILFFLVFLASYASCADHEAFKNCSRVPFCNSMRNAKPTSPLIAQLLDLSITKNSVSIPISNDKQKFNIQVVLLNKHTARVNILENDSTRYELKDVLDKEPTQLEVTVDKSVDNQVTIKPVNSEYSHSVLVEADPLKIKFYHDDGTLQSVFNGDNVIFDTDSQSFAFEVEFINAIKLYGLHHHAADLELPDTQETKIDPFRLRNSDIANYEVGSPMAMYGAVPAVYGHTGIYTSGIFLHNAAEQWIDISYGAASASAKFMVESAALDLFVFLGNTTKEVVRQFVEITGRAHMPQLWTLGYHQCRWSYFTQEDAQEVVAQMDTHDLPMDGIWLDIDYTNGYRYFTWNPENYSDPIAFQKNISSTNRKIVTILDPHIKVDEDYPVYANAKGKYFVKKENGKDDFEGSCWPGVSSYLDFLNPEARDYYASWYSYDKFKNTTSTIAGVWNDMNEPSVFDTTTENTMPFDAVHHGNVAHRDIHNIYGFLQTKATHQGLMQRDNGTKRPFILTRSHFAGSQRYTAMWTGDNTADWPYLRVSYSECILSNLMGLVFCGADVGGFFGDPEVELVERWYQAGIWLPFYRGHAHLDSKRREPYLYNSTVRDVIRTALRTRYKHVPVWYTLFYEHVRNGDPVIRPLFYDYPDLVSKDNHIMLGSDILARPVMEKGATSIDVTFPGEANNYWYRDDNSFELFTGGATKTLPVDIETSPYFYKGGSIIARRDTVRRSTSDALKDPYSIYVNLDANNEASGRLYVDDYTSFAYQDDKIFCYLNISYFDDTGGVHVELIDGTCINIGIEFSHIIIHRKSPKNEKKYTRTEITTLSEGTPLKDFKLGPALNKQKKLVLKL